MFVDRIPVRLRLSLAHAVWMAVLFLAVGVGLYKVVEHNLYRSTDAALLTAAKSIREARFAHIVSPPTLEGFIRQFFRGEDISPYAQLVDLSGNISAKSDKGVNLPVTPSAWARAKIGRETAETINTVGRRRSRVFNEAELSSVPIRMVTLPVIRYGKFTGELVQVGTPLKSALLTLRELAWVLWVSLPAGLFMSVLFGYALTKRAFKPVQEISFAAATMGSEDLSLRLPLPTAKDEIRTLSKTFNDLMERLDDAFMRLRRFNGDVSHELRTPLAVLKGEAELALRRERTPEEYKAALGVIAGEAKNMTEIVEDLLLLARAESRSLAMSWDPIYTKQFVSSVAAQVQGHYEQKNVTLKITNEASAELEGHAKYLSLSLKNILINAAKHSVKDGIVEFNISDSNQDILFSIKDTGEGIPAESQAYIFDPFYRADTARNRAAGGTGIGLSLAMALVKLHKGNISVQSVPGQGATFIMRVPRKSQGNADLKKKNESHRIAAKKLLGKSVPVST